MKLMYLLLEKKHNQSIKRSRIKQSTVQGSIFSPGNLNPDVDGWTSPPLLPLSFQGPVNHVRTVSIGEKRQPAPSSHTTVNKSHALLAQVTKSTPGTRYAAQSIHGT